jgi:hypothetical protein
MDTLLNSLVDPWKDNIGLGVEDVQEVVEGAEDRCEFGFGGLVGMNFARKVLE